MKYIKGTLLGFILRNVSFSCFIAPFAPFFLKTYDVKKKIIIIISLDNTVTSGTRALRRNVPFRRLAGKDFVVTAESQPGGGRR